MFASFYLLVGLTFYLLVENRRKGDYLSASEMLVLVASWPWCLLYIVARWLHSARF